MIRDDLFERTFLNNNDRSNNDSWRRHRLIALHFLINKSN